MLVSFHLYTPLFIVSTMKIGGDEVTITTNHEYVCKDQALGVCTCTYSGASQCDSCTNSHDKGENKRNTILEVHFLSLDSLPVCKWTVFYMYMWMKMGCIKGTVNSISNYVSNSLHRVHVPRPSVCAAEDHEFDCIDEGTLPCLD